MERKSFKYGVNIDWEIKHQGFLKGDFTTVQVACPIEFGGPGKVISPEELFVASAAVCLMTTFIDFLEKARIQLISYSSSAHGLMEFVDGNYRFSKIFIRPIIVIKGRENVSRCIRLLEMAHNACPIRNSIVGGVGIEPTISGQ